jgi:hypothetical protein
MNYSAGLRSYLLQPQRVAPAIAFDDVFIAGFAFATPLLAR